ncbi:alpha/beta fold hydrolase [Mycobacterium kyogaense]|uniref:alpha/beta fold hydrolase n=1 Tax=Mycobacterium kyogaense TaxID=2212479 RepID=UPI000DAF3675|nr:alpha/beta hydrolase [Mycobacterium kyogaense]
MKLPSFRAATDRLAGVCPPDVLDPPPTWFVAALGNAPSHSTVDVDGYSIHLRSWGDPALPTLVLVHGGGAHSGWWDHIAPLFADTHHVVAPDLSGHGDSDRRREYSIWTWAEEVLAAGTALNANAFPTVVGHSMGGWVTAAAATRHGAEMAGIAVIDTPLQEHLPDDSHPPRNVHPPRGYYDRADLLARFRLIPPQTDALPFVTNHIAEGSICERDGRWYWKFDPDIFTAAEVEFSTSETDSLERLLAGLQCRAAYMRCEHGVVPTTMSTHIKSVMQLRGPFIELPAAGHHPMIDQPLALVAALRAVLEIWSII